MEAMIDSAPPLQKSIIHTKPSELSEAACVYRRSRSNPTLYNHNMFARRRHRLITVLFALCSLLFMQLAVAAYACPGNTGKVSEAAAMAEAGMPCAGDMSLSTDDDQPGLCHAHCQSAQQTVEKVQAPSPVDAVSVGFAFTIYSPLLAAPPAGPAQASLLLRSTAPPIAVRNCCFRI